MGNNLFAILALAVAIIYFFNKYRNDKNFRRKK